MLTRLGRNTQELVNLVKDSRDTFSSFAKAKSAKLGTKPCFHSL